MSIAGYLFNWPAIPYDHAMHRVLHPELIQNGSLYAHINEIKSISIPTLRLLDLHFDDSVTFLTSSL